MPLERPHLIVLAGPNGAGKTTASVELLRGTLGVHEFVNADTIAKGLSEFNPEGAAIEAGRVMLRRLHHLTDQRLDVAFETTLASRSLAPWIRELMQTGYAFYLFYFFLPSPDLAVERVAERVSLGGHHVPQEVVRRRYEAGLRNFFGIYRTMATRWRFFDNSVPHQRRLIAGGGAGRDDRVHEVEMWTGIERQWNRG
ncbi:MAG TPA: zeta toxin family protein [Bryobacteraceae bacterium]|nr:zeta toxin family protein [Bryobacteraceae bacterium]